MTLKTTLTLQQMRSATKAAILQNVSANNTKREIAAELLGQTQVRDRVVITRDDQGRNIRRVEVWRDLLTGDRLGGRVTTKSYYDTGEINRIIISERDADNNETARRTIRHFTDGRQPTEA